jgi:ribosomal protein S18 acetylase RimI-like enzyme
MEAYCNSAFNPTQLAQELNNPNSAFNYAVEDGIPIGYLKINFGPAQTEPLDAMAMEVERIYVRQAHRGRGVGHMLLHSALSNARQRKAPFVWLGVWEHNQRAIAFYRKQGFTVFGSHPFRLGNDLQTDLLMRHRLEPERSGMP